MGYSTDTILAHLQSLQNSHSQRHPEGAHGEKLEGVRQWGTRLFSTLAEQLAKVRDDAHLTSEGKRQRVTELAKKTDLSFLVSARTASETDLARLHGLLFAIPKSERDPTLAFLYEDALRRKYEGQPQPVIQQAYLDAVKTGDHERVRAFTDEALGILADKDFGRRALLEHAEKAQPAVFANYAQTENLQDHLRALERHAQSVLRALEDGA